MSNECTSRKQELIGTYTIWVFFFSNKKMVEGVIPEEIVNECTTRRQELIGTCTIWVFLFFSSNQSSFCFSYDNDQSEQRKISQGANGNSEWNEVKFSVGKCQSSSPDYFKFWIWLDESLRERGKFSGPISHQISIQHQANKWWEWRKISIRGLLVDSIPNSLIVRIVHHKNCMADS